LRLPTTPPRAETSSEPVDVCVLTCAGAVQVRLVHRASAVALPETLNDLTAVQRLDICLGAPVHERGEVLPVLDGQPPVLGHAGRGFVDLVENKNRVPGGLGIGIDRVGEFWALGDLVGQQGGVAVTGMAGHELAVTGEYAVALSDVVGTDGPHDDDIGLSEIGHNAVLLLTRALAVGVRVATRRLVSDTVGAVDEGGVGMVPAARRYTHDSTRAKGPQMLTLVIASASIGIPRLADGSSADIPTTVLFDSSRGLDPGRGRYPRPPPSAATRP